MKLRLLLAGVAAALALPLDGAAGPFDAVSTFSYSRSMHRSATRRAPTRPRRSRRTPTSPSGAGTRTTATTTGSGSSTSRAGEPEGGARLSRVLRQPGRRDRLGRRPRPLLELARARRHRATASRCRRASSRSGWENLHVFDIGDPTNPDLVASVETECGSHTATGVPDLANGRLLVYGNPSSGACRDSTSSRCRSRTPPARLSPLRALRAQLPRHRRHPRRRDEGRPARAETASPSGRSIRPPAARSRIPPCSTRLRSRASRSGTPRRSPGTARCSSSGTEPAVSSPLPGNGEVDHDLFFFDAGTGGTREDPVPAPRRRRRAARGTT